jgi:putative transposase
MPWKDYRQAGKAKVMTLAAGEFIRRFLMHTLPDSFHRIRYYGLFANGHRAEKLAICRRLLGVSTASPSETDGTDHLETATSTNETHICPSCGGRMITIETFEGSDANRRQMHPVISCDSS